MTIETSICMNKSKTLDPHIAGILNKLQILSRCKYMYEIMKFVVCDPELPDLSSRSLPNTFDFQLKVRFYISSSLIYYNSIDSS